MAIAFRAVGAYVSGVANLTPVIPAAQLNTDMMLCFYGTKPYNDAPTINQGWTDLGNATDGVVAAGVDVGSMQTRVFYKVATSDAETNPIITNSTNNVSGAVIIVFSRGGSSWATPLGAGGGDATAGTGFSVTASSDVGHTIDDMVAAYAALRSDAATQASIAVTIAGCTMGTFTESPATDLATTSGGDMAMSGGYVPITAGTSTAAPVYASTLAANHTGSAFVVRLRELANQTFPQAVTAGAVASTATMIRSVAKNITATAAVATAIMIRGLTFAKSLVADLVTGTATMLRSFVFIKALTSGAVTTIATLSRVIEKGVTASVVVAAATLAKIVQKTITASSVVTTAVLNRALTFLRTLTATAVSTATVLRALTFGRTIEAVVASTATILRGLTFGRTLSAVSTAVAKLLRQRSFGIPFLYTAANWGTVSFYLEVWMRASVGTARARLWNETDGVAVAGSDLTTASGSYVRLRTGALILTDGKLYNVQFGSEDADSGAFRGGKLVVV